MGYVFKSKEEFEAASIEELRAKLKEIGPVPVISQTQATVQAIENRIKELEENGE